MTIKLIAIDIDGTLLNSAHQVTDEVRAVLRAKADAGVKIVLCTGRPIIGVLPLIKELGLDTVADFAITYNGSLVQNNATGNVVVQHSLTHEDFLDVEYLSRKLNVHMHTQDRHAMYTSNRDISKYTIVEGYLTGIPLKYRAVDEMDPEMVISKMMLIDEPEILDKAIKNIPAEFHSRFTLVKSADFYLEILNKEASKGNAVRDLAQHLGIKQAETMAIGDNENDLSMLEYAGIGIAMANGTENVRTIADHITKSNDESGVAHAIKTWA